MAGPRKGMWPAAGQACQCLWVKAEANTWLDSIALTLFTGRETRKRRMGFTIFPQESREQVVQTGERGGEKVLFMGVNMVK